MDYQFLRQLPEANPIISVSDLAQIQLKIFSLYALEETDSQIQESHNNIELQKDSPQGSLSLNCQTLEELCSTFPLVYDKYASMTLNEYSKFLKPGQEFNQMICNLQRLTLFKKSGAQTPHNNERVLLQKESLSELRFDSDFECGNLSKVVRMGERDYALILQYDINSRGHTQWFYFRIRNGSSTGNYRFQIVNLSKHGYLYDCGMKIAIRNKKSGWTRGGTDILYRNNGILKRPLDETSQERWYTLAFNYEFQNSDDEVFFAQSIPYTLRQLNSFFQQLEENDRQRKYINRQLLCKSLLGNRVEKITITDPSNPEHDKKGIVIMGRVHPGETVSSYMVEGLISWLVSDDEQAISIRQNFVFKIIPMLNPDGVVHGNYRCSLAGCDLNRRWHTPIKELHPEIYHAKQMIMQLNKSNKVTLMVDCHGHNLKRSIFMYGCISHPRKKQNEDVRQSLQNLACKQFAYLLSKIDKNFSYKNSSFVVQRDRANTARVTLWHDLKIPQVYTLEASFCGPEQYQHHFSTRDLNQMGSNLGKGIYQYFFDSRTGEPIRSRYYSKHKPNEPLKMQEILNGFSHLHEQCDPISDDDNSKQEFHKQLMQLSYDDKEDSNGSASEPSDDNLSVERLRRLIPKSLRSKLSPKKPRPRVEEVSSIPTIPQLPPSQPEKIKPKIAQYSISQSLKIRLRMKKRLDDQKKEQQQKHVEVPVKLFDASWLTPSTYHIQQELRQQRLIQQILESRYRRELESMVVSKFAQHRMNHKSEEIDYQNKLEQNFISIAQQSPLSSRPNHEKANLSALYVRDYSPDVSFPKLRTKKTSFRVYSVEKTPLYQF